MVDVPSVFSIIFPLLHSGGVLSLPGIHGGQLGLNSLLNFIKGCGFGSV
jgi:hypothetical protein